MPELRKHYFLDEYCIIATERQQRPSDFKREPEEKRSAKCQFCPGNEEMTPPATAVYKRVEGKIRILKDGQKRVKDWVMRCFPNLYPALVPAPTVPELSHWTKLPGYGFHEIIVETPEHEKRLSTFSDEQIELLMSVYKDRVSHYREQKDVQYVSLFKNRGVRAGASLAHTHTQLIAMPMVPPLLQRELQKIEEIGRCPYCDIIAKERDSERFVCENDGWVLFAPFCSQTPFELWALPKKHVHHISALDELGSLGAILRDALRKLDKTLGCPSYNYMFFQLDDEAYHLNIRIQPKLTIRAGFEKNTDVYINTVAPESAAKYLI